jgi:glutaredoxin
MPKVDIYYARVCGLCTEAIEFFRNRGITFTAYAVEWDGPKDEFVDSPIRAEMYRRCGGKVDIVPQIFIDDLHIRGWRKLQPMIASGEIDQILPKA